MRNKNFFKYQLLIFVIAFLVSLLYLSHGGELPKKFPDSGLFIDFAKDVSSFKIPETIYRTPVYPFFLLPSVIAGSLDLMVLAQIILNCLSYVLIFRISFVLSKNSLFSLLIAITAIFNLNVFLYQFAILSETASVFVFLLFLYYHLKFLDFESLTKKRIIYLFIIDALLIFTKPIFIILPILIYSTLIIYYLFSKTNFLKLKIKFYALGIIISALCIVSWSGLNYWRYHKFVFTEVSRIDLLGKVIQYGYLDNYQAAPQDPEFIKIAADFGKNDPEKSPYNLMNYLDNKGFDYPYNSVSKFFISKNLIDYIWESFNISVDCVSQNRSNVVFIDINALYDRFVGIYNIIKLRINPIFLLFIPVVYNLCAARQFKLAGQYLICLIPIFYIVLITGFLAYGDYGRILVPVELMIDMLEFLIIGWLLKIIIRSDNLSVIPKN